MGNVFFFQFEVDFILWLQSIGANSSLQSILISLFNGVSFLGEELVCVVIFGAIYWGISKEKARELAYMIIIVQLAFPLIKNIVKRSRPWFSNSNIKNLRDVDGYSFPSGHSSHSSCIYNALSLLFKKKIFKVIALVVPPLIALSRNYLGAHFVTDVLAGLILGYGTSFLVDKYYDKLNNYKTLFIILAIASIGLFYCTSTDYYNSLGLLIGLIAAFKFEEKFVKFETTDKWYVVVIRTLLGGGIFVGLDKGLKTLFSLLVVSDYATLLLRTLRYSILMFVLIAIYPLLFKPLDRLFKR